MKFISTKVHGVLDYLMGIFLIVMPWLFGFAAGGSETWIPVIIGSVVIVYSIFTNYELGVVKAMSMRNHIMLDMLGGLFLAASPWIFNFDEFVFWPHLIIGVCEVLAASFTKTTPYHVRVNSKGVYPTTAKP